MNIILQILTTEIYNKIHEIMCLKKNLKKKRLVLPNHVFFIIVSDGLRKQHNKLLRAEFRRCQCIIIESQLEKQKTRQNDTQ